MSAVNRRRITLGHGNTASRSLQAVMERMTDSVNRPTRWLVLGRMAIHSPEGSDMCITTWEPSLRCGLDAGAPTCQFSPWASAQKS